MMMYSPHPPHPLTTHSLMKVHPWRWPLTQTIRNGRPPVSNSGPFGESISICGRALPTIFPSAVLELTTFSLGGRDGEAGEGREGEAGENVGLDELVDLLQAILC